MVHPIPTSPFIDFCTCVCVAVGPVYTCSYMRQCAMPACVVMVVIVMIVSGDSTGGGSNGSDGENGEVGEVENAMLHCCWAPMRFIPSYSYPSRYHHRLHIVFVQGNSSVVMEQQ